MSNQEQKSTRKTDVEKPPSPKKSYEKPAIEDEGSFETVVLSCAHITFGDCGPTISS